jgi:hypothetical protein
LELIWFPYSNASLQAAPRTPVGAVQCLFYGPTLETSGTVAEAAMPTNSDTLLSPAFAVQRFPEASMAIAEGAFKEPRPIAGVRGVLWLTLSSVRLPFV